MNQENNNKVAWVNGDFVKECDAKISIFDRGLLFADAVYEVCLVQNSKVFNFKAHYQRLVRSLSLLGIPNPFSEKKLGLIIDGLIKENQAQAGSYSLYLQISRGNQNPRKAIYQEVKATDLNCFMTLNPIVLNKELKLIKAKLDLDIRWDLTTIKTTNLLANSYLMTKANLLGFDEVILHKNNLITECSSSNIFIYKNKQIHTPKLNSFILPGTTRNQIITLVKGLSKELKIDLIQRDIELTELTDADAIKQIDDIWVSSSTKLVWRINQIDDKKINHKSDISEVLFNKLLQEVNSL